MRAKNLSGIVVRVMITLLCLVLFSSHLASGMFARYVSTGEDGGYAKVAKYDVKAVPIDDGTPMAADVNGNVSYKFRIDNSGSEVAVKYTKVYVYFSDCYDGDVKTADIEGKFVSVLLDGVRYTDEPVKEYKADDTQHLDPVSYMYTFDVDGMIEAGGASDALTLTFNTLPSWSEETDNTLAPDTISPNTACKYPVRILVESEQIN